MKKIFVISLFVLFAAINFSVMVNKADVSDLSTVSLVNIAMAGGNDSSESGSSNDPVAVGTVYTSEAYQHQTTSGDYYLYGQSATKYYDPNTNRYFYQFNAPTRYASSSESFSGHSFCEPIPTGTVFWE